MIQITIAKRIIPCLDVKDGLVVKGKQFQNLQYAGIPHELAKKYEEDGADEVIFLDITATLEGRKTLLQEVEKTAENVFIPLTVGGGIRTIEDISSILRHGADKVSINTAAFLTPSIIKEGARIFGCQCIVCSIDAKRKFGESSNAKYYTEIEGEQVWWEVYITSAKKATGKDAVEWAMEVEQLGCGEILLTSIDFDGTKKGYDLPLLKLVSEHVDVPIIASGGAGKPEHFYDAAINGADAILAASIFHYGDYTISEIKEYLHKKGIHVRL